MRNLYRNFRWGFDGEPQTLLEDNGRVVFREPLDLAPDIIDSNTIDLGGKYLLPAFIDSHCHILPAGLDLQKLHLGECNSRDDVLARLHDHLKELDEEEWLLAVQYDHTKFEDGEHLTRSDLDSVSTDRPILLRHANGHAGVANTACLERAGIDEATPDPKGGKFVRDASGLLNGVLLEHANEIVSNKVKSPTLEQMVDAIMKAGDRMAAYGIACASDMMTGRFDLSLELQAYRIAAEQGCKVRTRLYLMWGAVFGPRAFPRKMIEDLEHAMQAERCQISGIKIFADGAIASATAAIYGQYLTSEKPETEAFVDGQLIYSQDRLRQMVRSAHEAGYPIAIHSIGDHSTDMVMEAYSELDDPTRHRIEHAMILSDSQIESMERLGIHCCMQPEFSLAVWACVQAPTRRRTGGKAQPVSLGARSANPAKFQFGLSDYRRKSVGRHPSRRLSPGRLRPKRETDESGGAVRLYSHGRRGKPGIHSDGHAPNRSVRRFPAIR